MTRTQAEEQATRRKLRGDVHPVVCTLTQWGPQWGLVTNGKVTHTIIERGPSHVRSPGYNGTHASLYHVEKVSANWQPYYRVLE